MKLLEMGGKYRGYQLIDTTNFMPHWDKNDCIKKDSQKCLVKPNSDFLAEVNEK